ncbi:MAG: hypothetical protein A3K26_07775 [Tenericutes bacterium RIFOXYA12_FULL_35_10]|nr:MAG: hypothetical protein A2012_07240 [Tenericutes bacterium GWE2_34_108]OHE36352.1 MAG: hypothetical protein A2Y46_00140 [Tenericutes bacterium GWF1_35_14]OHE37736.1 MAG: hypothetical protein A2Y44_00095 [Tenericutes bacterium GWF2_35_184]OHE41873.1 MAG: hypothetical protein A3K26_07775 [Tenericutes bacterium RIFOXYA12_FULL_35_10]OHE44682.1 MAG: hypothetical protein A2221_00565 [Tenericutes bacterium RIFOXYA2_FULL_36_32]OHE47834.1 MAG: hypothetical protein A2308_00100 [Tenericutes bacteriu
MSIEWRNKENLIWTIKQLRIIYNESKPNSEQTKCLIKLVRESIKSHTNHNGADYISSSAKSLLDESKLKMRNHGDLNKANKVLGKRGLLTLDHLIPAAKQAKEVLFAKTDDDAINLLDKFPLALITSDENKRINENKEGKQDRPNGWEEIYKKSGIVLEIYKK